MVQSMTGFASGQGSFQAFQWAWDIRSVNAKGLDIRQRVPDWITGLEAELKSRIGNAIARGSVSVSLRVSRESSEGKLSLNEHGLANVLSALAMVEKAAIEQGVSLTPPTPADILSMRGVMDQTTDDGDTTDLKNALIADFEIMLQDFIGMRKSEGHALELVLHSQVNDIAQLIVQAEEIIGKRREDLSDAFKAAVTRVADATDHFDTDRIAQEVAIIAVKNDVTEEIDRLKSHVDAARTLLKQGEKIGRKLDFLSQEFNREANTLCSKSQHKDLTAVGLELKAVIDQMREQVQNVE